MTALLRGTRGLGRYDPGSMDVPPSDPVPTIPAAARRRAEKLQKELQRHNHLYHVEAAPQISDREFDQLMQELAELEKQYPDLQTPDSPTLRVGGEPIEGFKPVRHAVPMMSIDNTYNADDLREWDARVRRHLAEGASVRYVLEPKVDGVAVSLRYEKGALAVAATRGDGRVGDDISHNARTVRSIAIHLRSGNPPPVLEVRGEIYMPNSVFQRINNERAANDEQLFANPRNATAGTLKQLDPRIAATRSLRFVAHGLGETDGLKLDSYNAVLQLIRAFGLPISPHTRTADDVEGVLAIIGEFEQTRATLDFQTDGMVVKVDDFAQRRQLGTTSRFPRWVIAYKYPAEQAQTLLHDVTWQVGKNGTLTPVAELEPVFVAGTTVRRASLHNIEQIERLGVRIGDTVTIEKAGEIIPQVVGVVEKKRPKGAKHVVAPARCPSCDAEVVKDADSPYIRCVNPACPKQLKERLRWFCARGQMDVERLGVKLIDQLVDARKLGTFADIYRLTKDDLLGVERVGEKSAENVLAGVEASRGRGLDRLLAGLGIRHVGTATGRDLAAAFGSLDALMSAGDERIAAVHGIGEVIAKSVRQFLDSDAGRDAIARLQGVGIDPKQEVKVAAAGEPTAAQPLAGMTVVVTGSLEHFTRQRLEERIRQLGGKTSASVSKSTNLLVAGERAGSKLEKAKSLGVEVIDERAFLERFG